MARFEYASKDVVEFAAQGGSPDALFELGLMYCAGRGVDIDLVAAHKWFNLAAMRGNREARTYRLELAQEMTKSQVAKAQRQAREWMSKH